MIVNGTPTRRKVMKPMGLSARSASPAAATFAAAAMIVALPPKQAPSASASGSRGVRRRRSSSSRRGGWYGDAIRGAVVGEADVVGGLRRVFAVAIGEHDAR